MLTDATCPDYPPDFGELHIEDDWLRACARVHPEDPWRCLGKLAELDQLYAATDEFNERYAAGPVIVGTFDPIESRWLQDAIAPAYAGDDAPGWMGIDPEVMEALKCEHLRVGPRPSFRWAEAPWWKFCHGCHWDLIALFVTSAERFSCRRCGCKLNADNFRMRALLETTTLTRAFVCVGCARVFDRVEPRADGAPPPGTPFYAARVHRRVDVNKFAAALRAVGAIPTEPQKRAKDQNEGADAADN